MRAERFGLLLLAIGSAALLAGCGARHGTAVQAADLPPPVGHGAAIGGDAGTAEGAGPGSHAGVVTAVATADGAAAGEGDLRDIYFDFDSFTLSRAAKEALAVNAEWIRRTPAARLLVEGHTDERGTVAYNLALGERRAVAVRDYLVGLGVGADRLSTISYGKERPADPGHTEAAWAKNRRAHSVAMNGPSAAASR